MKAQGMSEVRQMIRGGTGVKVSNGAVVHTIEEALRAFKRLVAPVVVKPVVETRGRGQSLNLMTESELWEAFFNAKKYSESVWVEENFDRDFVAHTELQ
jgi:formate-dependent phosphoribosylglycinamide formyltransferase (GAR transformylase)